MAAAGGSCSDSFMLLTAKAVSVGLVFGGSVSDDVCSALSWLESSGVSDGGLFGGVYESHEPGVASVVVDVGALE